MKRSIPDLVQVRYRNRCFRMKTDFQWPQLNFVDLLVVLSV